MQRLRRILLRRRHFVRLGASQVNAAKFLLRSVGQTKQVTSLKSVQAWQRLLENFPVESVRSYLAMRADLWRLAREKVVALEQELKEALKPFEEVRGRLETAPGVGVITAATFIAVLGTPHRFPDSGRVVSYIGLVPSTWDTGDQQRHGHITRRGSAALRAVLCEAAHHAASKRHPLNPYFARLCAKHGYKRAVVAVAQRLARILFQMWRKGESFDETQLNVVAERRTRTRTFYWRIKRSQEQATAA